MKFAVVSAIVIGVLASNSHAGYCGPLFGTTKPEAILSSRPEIVRLESEKQYSLSGVKTVIAGNARGRYTLSCNFKAAGCISLNPGSDYYVVKKETRWKMTGMTRDIDLATVQSFTANYFDAENIGLVRVDSRGEPGSLGMFILGAWAKK